MKTLKIFTADGCQPCSEVKSRIEAGKVDIEGVGEDEEVNVEYHDIASEEDFKYVEELALKKVPTAFLEKQECEISFEDDQVFISCPAEAPSEKSAQP